ncbi:MarR family winged helix-turn-helix transcriptional regulator [Saccharomonospora saliphila]|uniref:MarR family winged helix-turn-helix transcriptional regulator n=1 Tax=Saccharomonospora saliphila TaxID=369829 RepID=UPI0003621442|nr:MarR family transcriptional regulator [Saccharomonospora saliphila]
MHEPDEQPIGLTLSTTAKAVGRAFDAALHSVGGSRPVWLVLLTLVNRPEANQREIAEAANIRGATLTHHLAAMEADGLLTRRRDPDNRRVHLIELTDEGRAAFHRMRVAATEFDSALRTGVDERELALLRSLLHRLRTNVTD